VLAVFHLNNKEAKRELKVNCNNHGHPQKFFQGGNIEILLVFSKLLTMQYKWTLTNRFTLCTP